jgi:chorismate dehydratase
MSRLRVGIVDYLNSRPLAWGFLEGRFADRAEAVFQPPARVAEMLADGELDVGLIPVIEIQRIPGLRLIPHLCVGALHEVRSVLLIARGPIAEVRRVALDRNSRTSAALVQILLHDRWGLRPEVVEASPDADAMLADADAALIIGDPALAVDRQRYQIYDLAAEWRALTGLPAVFAAWAVGPGVAPQALGALFEESLAAGLAAIDRIGTEAADELELPAGEVHAYLTQYLSYRLGELELQALAEYWRRAHRLGLIDAPRPIPLWRDPELAGTASSGAAPCFVTV